MRTAPWLVVARPVPVRSLSSCRLGVLLGLDNAVSNQIRAHELFPLLDRRPVHMKQVGRDEIGKFSFANPVFWRIEQQDRSAVLKCRTETFGVR